MGSVATNEKQQSPNVKMGYERGVGEKSDDEWPHGRSISVEAEYKDSQDPSKKHSRGAT